jgi:hypothetical protein
MNIGTDIFEKYDMISEAELLRQKAINNAADLLINENLEAFKELAK